MKYEDVKEIKKLYKEYLQKDNLPIDEDEYSLDSEYEKKILMITIKKKVVVLMKKRIQKKQKKIIQIIIIESQIKIKMPPKIIQKIIIIILKLIITIIKMINNQNLNQIRISIINII